MQISQRLVWMIGFCAVWPTAAWAKGRPNIVLVMTDDHAYQAIGAYGSQINRTPQLDRLASEGMRFNRCYVTDSICAPSRATILTGKYGHLHGVINNYTPFDPRQTTFPQLLQRAGYQTALIGKWHLESDPVGFDFWDILPGQGKYYRPDFKTPAGVRQEPGYVTDLINRFALDWLRKDRDRERPFLLMVHHKAPHRPWDPGAEHLADYQDAVFPEPDSLWDDYQGRQAAQLAKMRLTDMQLSPDLKAWENNDRHRTWLYDHMSRAERAAWEKVIDPRRGEIDAKHPQGRDRVRWIRQHFLEDYLGCVASVDEGVGELLDCLDECGLADDTLFIYTSDQGFYLGEHGWFDKRFMYEQSLRTPLLVRWPGVATPQTVDEQIVSNVDLAETLLDAAGVPVPPEMQGRSLAPLLRGEILADWRKSFYYHYHEGAERDHAVPRHEGVTTGRHKLIHFYTLGTWELYDLEADPGESLNLAGKAEYAGIEGELKAELERLRQELREPPLNRDADRPGE